MSHLAQLKSATTLKELAEILGVKPKALSYLLYKKNPARKYNIFSIPKRSGGARTIKAPYPDLKMLQRRLAKLLQDCLIELDHKNNINKQISHGFKPGHSVITNASCHRKKQYVLNLDLSDFFGTINFGRIRGFLITNRNFELDPKIATVIAQIACHDNVLPQGSPCSPVISNMIGHLLDMRLMKLASDNGCKYSRYADDLTFSTNKKEFPTVIAKTATDQNNWILGSHLRKIIEKTGFVINEKKTRMQYRNSRQDVTGLVVNKKINTFKEYRKIVRARVNRLINTGSYQLQTLIEEADGTISIVSKDGSLNQLNGMLSYIDSVNLYNKEKDLTVEESKKKTQPKAILSSFEKTYRHFLIYKNFYSASTPTIICEGKTDNIYLKCAMKSLAKDYPQFHEATKTGGTLKIKFFQRSATAERILALTGGTGEFVDFIKEYFVECRIIKAKGQSHPIILLVDNDEGVKALYAYLKNLTKKTIDRKDPFVYVGENLYIIPTPLTSTGGDTMIESFFEKSLLETELKGKKFNPGNTLKFDPKLHYSKAHFAEYVIRPNQNKINFEGFKVLLNSINEVIEDYKRKAKK